MMSRRIMTSEKVRQTYDIICGKFNKKTQSIQAAEEAQIQELQGQCPHESVELHDRGGFYTCLDCDKRSIIKFGTCRKEE